MLLACRLHSVQPGLLSVTHRTLQSNRQRQSQSRSSHTVACKRSSSETALAAVLLASAVALTPAVAIASSDYISVQERINQRSVLRDRAASRSTRSADAASNIPVQEQARLHIVTDERAPHVLPVLTLAIAQVRQVRELSAKAQAAVDAGDYEQVLQRPCLLQQC